MILARIGIAGAALVAMAACTKGALAPSTTTTTGATIAKNDDAATRLTYARCDREAACNGVGAGLKYADRDACMRELGRSDRAELRAENCPNGISEARLTSCMEAVRNESCRTPLDMLDRIQSCRSDRLCAEAPERSD